MATARISIEQNGLRSGPGVSRDDLTVGDVVTFRNGDDNGVVSWRWLLVSRPRGSSAVLSNVVAAQPTLTPDVTGTYTVQLTVNEGRDGQVSRVLAAVRNAPVLGFETRYIGAAETDEANWDVDLGGGPRPNTQGWWEDLDRWLRVLYQVASGGSGGGTWGQSLAAGNRSGGTDAVWEEDDSLWQGVYGGMLAAPNSLGRGLYRQLSFEATRTDTNAGAFVSFGPDILSMQVAASLRASTAVIEAHVILTRPSGASRLSVSAVLREVWVRETAGAAFRSGVVEYHEVGGGADPRFSVVDLAGDGTLRLAYYDDFTDGTSRVFASVRVTYLPGDEPTV